PLHSGARTVFGKGTGARPRRCPCVRPAQTESAPQIGEDPLMAGPVATVITLCVAFLLVAGSVFSLLAAVGLLRFPDLYTRMHAASKAGTIGSGLLLFAAG